MISFFVTFLQSLKDPRVVVCLGVVYIAVYYFMAERFHRYAKFKKYSGVWKKWGVLDIVSSVVWIFSALGLIASLLDLLIRNNISLLYVFLYYILFIFLFAFIYSLLDWHFEGMIESLEDGLIGEIQCVTMSIQVMTGGYHTSAKPADWRVEAIAGVQAILGVMFVAIFVAKAVLVFAPAR
jgi:hypothetical protein